MKPEILKNELLSMTATLLGDNRTLGLKMQGFSMFPTFKEDDYGYIESCTSESLTKGDLVVFRHNNTLVAHRLIDIKEKNGAKIFIAKGDKNYHNDAPFTENELVGKVISFKRNDKLKNTNSPFMRWQRFIALNFHNVFIPMYNLQILIKSHLSNFKYILKSLIKNVNLFAKGSTKLLIINAIIAILQGVMPFVLIVCIKLLIDALTNISTQNLGIQFHLILLLIVTASVFLISGLLTEIRSYFSEKLSQSVILHIYEKLHSKHASLDLSHYESPTDQDKIHRAVQEASFRPIKIINELLTAIRSIAASLFLIGLFITIKWYLIALLIIAILPGVFFRLKFSRKLYKLKETQSTKEREMYYFNRVHTGFPFAKEMKLFGFFQFFKVRFNQKQADLFEEKISLRKSELRVNIAAQVFAVLLIFVALGYVSYLKLNGAISIGTVVLFFFAFQRGYSVLNDLFYSLTKIVEDNTYLNDFMDFLNMPTSSDLSEENATFTLEKEIKIENVRFKYETSKRDALKALNISIPAGKTVAFVGANGSGKTTLIKLLCGFYQPMEGHIFYDGNDARLIGQHKICKNITAVFQDFALYNISALENLCLGDVDAPIDLERAKKAAKAAGIDTVLENLPDGYSNLLGNLFKTGEELSIGQWQKIAIARAYYRNSPFIIMDEPSSALDAQAESQIINSLKLLAHNKTAIIISHRLSTVKMADLIFLFCEGEVIESGSHQELIALKGKYFELFNKSNSPEFL